MVIPGWCELSTSCEKLHKLICDYQLYADYSLQPNVYCHTNLTLGTQEALDCVFLWMLFAKIPVRPSFSTFTWLTFGQITLLCGCLTHNGMFSSIPGLDPVGASSNPSSHCDKQKFLDIDKMCTGRKNCPPAENYGWCKSLENAVQHRIHEYLSIWIDRHIHTHTHTYMCVYIYIHPTSLHHYIYTCIHVCIYLHLL